MVSGPTKYESLMEPNCATPKWYQAARLVQVNHVQSSPALITLSVRSWPLLSPKHCIMGLAKPRFRPIQQPSSRHRH
ncbi:MAG: hypothetical protein FRX48_06866 [Lasallia pustulata]|uniref:Uncharacterized protein n=1 Tax=Lasallia pustulata TaxID=136370 RepID=A0A5M8PIS3_9LECA|nr:MAG: hypothetical protein FRX48_06866 [Lasallia pustulata]